MAASVPYLYLYPRAPSPLRGSAADRASTLPSRPPAQPHQIKHPSYSVLRLPLPTPPSWIPRKPRPQKSFTWHHPSSRETPFLASVIVPYRRASLEPHPQLPLPPVNHGSSRPSPRAPARRRPELLRTPEVITQSRGWAASRVLLRLALLTPSEQADSLTEEQVSEFKEAFSLFVSRFPRALFTPRVC